eukprot:jgi/Botrbrau1/13038/Bobra.0187s0001.1
MLQEETVQLLWGMVEELMARHLNRHWRRRVFKLPRTVLCLQDLPVAKLKLLMQLWAPGCHGPKCRMIRQLPLIIRNNEHDGVPFRLLVMKAKENQDTIRGVAAMKSFCLEEKDIRKAISPKKFIGIYHAFKKNQLLFHALKIHNGELGLLDALKKRDEARLEGRQLCLERALEEADLTFATEEDPVVSDLKKAYINRRYNLEFTMRKLKERHFYSACTQFPQLLAGESQFPEGEIKHSKKRPLTVRCMSDALRMWVNQHKPPESARDSPRLPESLRPYVEKALEEINAVRLG